jgi:hypothetical protein
MYRAALVTPEMLLIEYSMTPSAEALPATRPTLSIVSWMVSVLCGIR